MIFLNLILNVIIGFNFISIGMIAQILDPKNKKFFYPNLFFLLANSS